MSEKEIRLLLQTRASDRSRIYTQLVADEDFNQAIIKMSELIYRTLADGGRMYICGNGGSAADAQHLAAEFSGRFNMNRPGLPVEALHVNSSFVTAVSNDYGFDHIFERAVEAFCRKGDILMCLSTSGESLNVIKAALKAGEKKVNVIGMSGKSGGALKNLCKYFISVDSHDTALIQEVHLFAGHLLCEYVEYLIFNQ